MPTEREKEMLGELQTVNNAIQERHQDQLQASYPEMNVIEKHEALLEVIAKHFKFGRDYDVLPGTDRRNKTDLDLIKDPKIAKFMKQPGAEFVKKCFGWRLESHMEKEILTPEHIFYRVRTDVFDRDGNKLSSTFRSASSYEEKWKYRWLTAEKVRRNPALSNVDLDRCESKKSPWNDRVLLYQVPNPELLGLCTTIEAMGEKRSIVYAIRTTSGLSGLFGQPLEEVQAAIERRRESEGEGEPKPARPASTDTKLSRAVGSLRALFDERCSQNQIKGKAKQDEQGKMFAAVGIYGWKDIISDEVEMKVEAWIDENLPEVEAATQGDLLS